MINDYGIKEIVKLAVEANAIKVVDGVNYFQNGHGHLAEVFPSPMPLIKIGSLTGLVDFVHSIGSYADRMIFVVDHKTVAYTEMMVDPKTKQRQGHAQAMFELDEEFQFGRKYKHDEFMVKLICMFMKTDRQQNFIEKVSTIKLVNTDDSHDTGATNKKSQSLGVEIAGDAKEFSVNLKPFRTFPEIDQPESPFIFRVDNEKYCALHECDGGAWKNQARLKIKQYLADKLDNKLTIIA